MNNRGFSLVEIMVAMGILAGVSLGVMRLSEMGSRTAKQTESKFEIIHTHNEILSVLSNRTACFNTVRNALGGAVDLTAYFDGSQPILAISQVRNEQDGVFLGPFPQTRAGIEIESSLLRSWNAPERRAEMVVVYNYRMGSNNQVTRTKQFDIHFDLASNNPNEMVGCIARSATEALDPLRVCNVALGYNQDAQAGDGAGENPYFIDGVCQFRFAARKEACDRDNGIYVKPIKDSNLNAYKYGGKQTFDYDVGLCTHEDLAQDTCYCKTSWKHTFNLVSPSNEYLTELMPIDRYRNVGPIFVIPELFPENVGANINGAPHKARVVKIKATARIQYKVPMHPFFQSVDDTTLPLYPGAVPRNMGLWEEPKVVPSVIVESGIMCWSQGFPSATPSGGGFYPGDKTLALSSTSTGPTWVSGPQNGTSANSFFYIGNFNVFGTQVSTGVMKPAEKRVFASSSGGPSHINQYFFESEAEVRLSPGDKCYLYVRPHSLFVPSPGASTRADLHPSILDFYKTSGSLPPGQQLQNSAKWSDVLPGHHLYYPPEDGSPGAPDRENVQLKIMGGTVMLEMNTNKADVGPDLPIP